MRNAVAFLVAVTFMAGGAVSAQNTATSSDADHDNSARKIIFRTAPNYPDLARKANLQGSVKVEAIVRPNGTVKATRVVGGNPVLVDAAAEAVSKWKFEPGPNETTQVIEVKFAPQ
jgi:TonB family protein